MDNRHHIAGSAEFADFFGVSRETVERLEIYARLLVEWQKTINLVAGGTIGELWHRHFADSAQLLALAPRAALVWVDLGTGGGFPGLVIGIMLAERPGSKLTLIDSDARKCAFLREVVRQTGLAALVRVDIVSERIENSANTTRVGPVDVVSARALAPLDRVFDWCHGFFYAETIGLLPKGREVDRELKLAMKSWRFDAVTVPSLTHCEGRIVVLRDLVRAARS